MDNSTEDLITTTTTDWDSGGSEGIDYVYEGQKSNATITTTSASASTSTRTEKQSPKSKSPGRKKSPKAKTHCHKCVCGHAATSPTEPPAEPADQTSVHPPADDDTEETIFEEDTESEVAGSRSRPPRHQIRPPSYDPEESGAYQHKPGHKDKGDKGDKKKGIATKVHRKRSPYIEEYPEDPNRPAILLKEHKVPRRFSGSDTKHIFDWQRSTSGSRGRSPTGKRQPPPPNIIKSSPKRSAHRRRRVESSEDRGDKPFPLDMNNAYPDIDEPAPLRHYRHSNHGMGMDVPTTMARASAWTEHHAEPTYASSWPLKSRTHFPLAQPRQHDVQYDSDDEIDEQPYKYDNGFDEHHGRRWTAAREMQVSKENETGRIREVPREVPREIGSHRETGRQREVVRGRERVAERRHTERHQPPPPPPPSPSPQDQYEPCRAPSLQRRRTVAGHTIGTIDQGRRSAATELCEIWRGRASDWESPYPSDGETWSDNDDDGIPPRMLLEGAPPPPREPTPTMLPPHDLRSHFGFAPRVRPPPITVRVPSPVPCPWPQRSRTWAGGNNMTNGFFLLEAPLTAEPVTMMGDTEEDMGCSGAPSQVSRGGWTYPLVRYHPKHHYAPPPPPPPPRRSRSPSPPIFSARKTKEFLSPVPTRVARFDFDAWGRERASKSSLALAPMALVY